MPLFLLGFFGQLTAENELGLVIWTCPWWDTERGHLGVLDWHRGNRQLNKAGKRQGCHCGGKEGSPGAKME